MVSKEKTPLFVFVDGIETPVPRDHHLSCLVMPIGDPWDHFFYPVLPPMIDSYILSYGTNDNLQYL